VRISGRCASEFLKAGSHRDITGTRRAVGGGDIQNHPRGRLARKSLILEGLSRSTCVYPGGPDVDFRVARRGGDQGAARRPSIFGTAAARQTGPVLSLRKSTISNRQSSMGDRGGFPADHHRRRSGCCQSRSQQTPISARMPAQPSSSRSMT
jgi:hypothetical protein